LAFSLPLEEESLRPSRLDHNKDIKENPLSDLVAQATQREDEAIGLQKGVTPTTSNATRRHKLVLEDAAPHGRGVGGQHDAGARGPECGVARM
jgi:hypothetical protein